MLGHKRNLDEFKRIKIIQSVFSDHSGMNLEINNKRKFEIHKYVKIKTIPNNQWIKEEITKEIGKYFEMNENKTAKH